MEKKKKGTIQSSFLPFFLLFFLSFFRQNQVRGGAERDLAGSRETTAFRAKVCRSCAARQVRGGDGQGEEHPAAQSQEGEELREIGEAAKGDPDESPPSSERDLAELGAEAYERPPGQQRLLG